MIVDERMVTYIRSLERPENPVIEAIEQEALDSFVPIIRKETQSFLKVMMLMNRPASRERRTDHPDRRGCPGSDEDTGRTV